MPRTNKPMDQQALQEEYEEIKMKLLMARFAEIEGKMLLDENRELSKGLGYLPTKKMEQKFVKRLNCQFTLLHLKRIARRLIPTGYKKVAVALTLCIVFLFTTFFSVEALRVKVMNMFIQVEKEYTEIRLGHDSQQLERSHLQVEWENAHVPVKVPKGYRITSVTNNQTIKSIEYKNNDEGYILFQQYNENSGMNVDTEKADEVIHITIQGQAGLVVRKKDSITVVWQDESRLFLILGKSSSLNKEELIEMAESVKVQK